MRLRQILLASSLLAFAAPAVAEEGMWTFDNFPAERMRETYGWAPDRAWLDRVQAAAVRLTGGCSGSFVSPEGLVLTNHHCVASCVADLASEGNDLLALGFTARSRGEERECPGQQAEVVTAITDVTERIQQSIGARSGADLIRARDSAIAAIESESCTDPARERCQVVSLYGGGQYRLYRYRKYADVRLVFAPEFQAAFFGGDPDNFNFPRYALDAAFLRVYEDGRPAPTPAHLRWNPRAPEPGEVTFVVGNPGSTQRLWTQSQLELRRDLHFPTIIPFFSEYRGRLIGAMAGDAERSRSGLDQLSGIENSFKVYTGQFQALRDEEFMGRLAAAEAELRARVAANPELRQSVGDPWSEVERANAVYRDLYLPYLMLEVYAGYGSDLYTYAEALVRSAIEREKPESERLPNYTSSRLPLLEQQVIEAAPTHAWLEELSLAFWLSKTREYLTAGDPRVRELLGRESPEALAQRLVAGTRLGDAAYRRQLWDGGLAAIRSSDDPLIRFVLANEPAARALLDRYRSEVEAPITAAQSRLARARFGIHGDTLYPDATFTLRISYGSVQGWEERGEPVPPVTNIGGMYERATGAPPYDLPAKWAQGERRVDKDVALDFTSTNDIIGGNSGSPVIARDGSVIGAAFDGNIHSIGGAYGFDARVNRTISVTAAAVEEALTSIYDAPGLVAELNSLSTTNPPPARGR